MKTKAPKQKFRMQTMTRIEREAARKVKEANAPVKPNRDLSMKGC